MEKIREEQLLRIAKMVEQAILDGHKARAAANKQAAREELFRNSLGVRLKKPKP